MSAQERETDGDADERSREIGLFEQLRALKEIWRGLAAARVGILAREIRGAGLAISAMVGMAVAAGCLAASTWLLLLGLGLHVAVKNGLSLEAAGLLLLAVNLVASMVLVVSVRRTSSGLFFKTTTTSLAASRGEVRGIHGR